MKNKNKNKKIVARVYAFVCALIVLFVPASYRAEFYHDVDISVPLDEKLLDGYMNYERYSSIDVSKFPSGVTDGAWILLENSNSNSSSRFVVISLYTCERRAIGIFENSSASLKRYDYNFIGHTDYDTAYYSENITGAWEESVSAYGFIQYIDYSDGTGDYWKNATSPYVCIASNCYVSVEGIDFIVPSNNHNGSVCGGREVYSKEIGYLKDITDKKQVLTNANGVQDLSTMRKVVSFAPTSTTGIDLTSGDYEIRVYGQMCFVKNGTNEVVNDDFPLVYYTSYDASDCNFTYNYQSLFDFVTESAENPYSAFDTIFGQITRSDNVYFQIYNKATKEYGGYVKSRLGMTSNMEEESIYTTVDNELKVDDMGYVDYDAPSSGGSGTTWEDAELNDTPVGSTNSDMQNFEDTLSMFTSTLGAVPSAIALVFSFLPSWCLGIIALSFSSFAIIAVIKFIRG